jgi:DOPA 4,5-dioxygenase
MTDPDAPWHAHIYFAPAQLDAAAALRDDFLRLAEAGGDSFILFVGRMMEEGVGPHPIPQYEVHFRERSVPAVTAMLEASGLRVLIHPLTDNDLADHTIHARWLGEPVELDVSTLDPPGHNQGIPRFGVTDF